MAHPALHNHGAPKLGRVCQSESSAWLWVVISLMQSRVSGATRMYGAAPVAASYQNPPWLSAVLTFWPLFLIIPWGLFLWPIMAKDWRFWAASEFRDEGCDERRESRYWSHEQRLAFALSFLELNVLLLLFLYVGVR